MSFSDTFKNERIADAYERLLLEAMLGNQALFVRRDEVEQAWTWVDGIIQSWEQSNENQNLILRVLGVQLRQLL